MCSPPGSGVVWLDLDLFESVKGMTVKKTAFCYPLRVVKLSVDPESNPWGLALDGFSGNGPHQLTKPSPVMNPGRRMTGIKTCC